MKTHTSDTDIRSDIRSLIHRHRFNEQKIQYRITSGTVRMSGELLYHGGNYSQNVPPAVVESFERDIVGMRGVRFASFDLENWKRLANGTWEQVLKESKSPYRVAG